MANTIKAMYPITLQNDGKTDSERNVVNINQERLNENFRNIADELIKLWASGDYTLNILSARIAKDEEVFVVDLFLFDTAVLLGHKPFEEYLVHHVANEVDDILGYMTPVDRIEPAAQSPP